MSKIFLMQYLGLIAFFVLFLMGNAYPANWKAAEKVRQGNNLYQEKKYDKALGKYNAAQEEKPESPEIQFNMADVFYRQGKYNEAADSYIKALEPKFNSKVIPERLNRERGKRFGAKTHYNIGNALFRQGRFQEALDAYKRSLEINPNDLDTKYNIEFTQQKMNEMLSQAKETQKKAAKERQERKQKGQEQGAQSGQEPKQEQGAPDKSKQESAETAQKGEPNQKDKGQAPKPGELSREAAERMLGALEEEEKSLPRNLELNKKQMQEQGVEKDW